MENAGSSNRAIKLFQTNFVSRKSYYEAIIVRAGFDDSNRKISVCFEVAQGKCKGFRVYTAFFLKGKGLARLSHLCASVGITGQLSDPSDLEGLRVKLRIVPEVVRFGEIERLVHRITRFHPAQGRSSEHGCSSSRNPNAAKGVSK